MRSMQSRRAGPSPDFASSMAFRVIASASPSKRVSAAKVTRWRAPLGFPGLPRSNGFPRVLAAFLRGPPAVTLLMGQRSRRCSDEDLEEVHVIGSTVEEQKTFQYIGYRHGKSRATASDVVVSELVLTCRKSGTQILPTRSLLPARRSGPKRLW